MDFTDDMDDIVFTPEEDERIWRLLKEAEEEAASTDVRYTLDEVLAGVRDTLHQHRMESAAKSNV
jgi:hypothetical protein